jgi:hypothetical protein
MARAMRDAAASLGKNFVDVATNIRATRWWKSGYGVLSHGASLASIGLALENRYKRVLIASTNAYNNLAPNGSHPLTDPLLSTSQLAATHDGAGFNRIQKTELLCSSDVALRSLRVCWQSQSDENCQNCNKCYRTVLTLMLLGHLDQCATFDKTKLHLEKIPKIYSEDDNDRLLLS